MEKKIRESTVFSYLQVLNHSTLSFSFQRFAFSPLLDDGSDADDEEEAEKLMADISDTMKFRNTRNSTSSSPRESRSVVRYDEIRRCVFYLPYCMLCWYD